jgi:hypothetical protein
MKHHPIKKSRPSNVLDSFKNPPHTSNFWLQASMDRELVENCLLSYRDKNVYIKSTPTKGGLGVFAITDLKPGTEVGDYQGDIVGSKVMRTRPDSGFRMEIGEDSGLYIDPIDENGRIKYICVCNYMNEPSPRELCNAAFFVDTINSRIYVRVVKQVKKDEEVLVSYGAHFKRMYDVNLVECGRHWEHWQQVISQLLLTRDFNLIHCLNPRFSIWAPSSRLS